jgi:ADP-ribosylglycohydrolase
MANMSAYLVFSDWLFQQQGLFAIRAPGYTCTTALGFLNEKKPHQNISKGCGAVMRIAPIGLFFASLYLRQDGDECTNETRFADQCYSLAVEASAITHHDKTSHEASAVFAIMIYYLALGRDLGSALKLALQMFEEHRANNETTDALKLACMLANDDTPMIESIQLIGRGFIAEQALAIAVYCALKTNSFNDGIVASVNHSGNSESTGSIAGQLMGIMYGFNGIPQKFLDDLELKDLIIEVADDLANAPDWPIDCETNQEFIDMLNKYPSN